MLRGRGLTDATFSSIASRMIVAIDTPRSQAIVPNRSRVSSGSVKVMRPIAGPRYGVTIAKSGSGF